LARKSTADDVYWWHFIPFHFLDVAQVWYARPVGGEHLGGVGVHLAMPGGGSAEHLLDGEIKATDPGEQGPVGEVLG
jgi:hypothetical protein